MSVMSCNLLETPLQATARPTALSGLVGSTRSASPPEKPDHLQRRQRPKYKLLVAAAKLNVKHKNTGGL